jgi:hypothetical protein
MTNPLSAATTAIKRPARPRRRVDATLGGTPFFLSPPTGLADGFGLEDALQRIEADGPSHQPRCADSPHGTWVPGSLGGHGDPWPPNGRFGSDRLGGPRGTGRPNRPRRGYWLGSGNTRPACARLDQPTVLVGARGVASRAARVQLNIPGMLSRPTDTAGAREATPGMLGGGTAAPRGGG